MRRLETHDWWPQLLSLKDERSLRQLASQFGVTAGAISAALRRQGISRTPAPPGPRRDRSAVPAVVRRRGSMDQIAAIHELVGTVPDDVIAEKAGVSRRTVANYRGKHGIAGYRGKRRRNKRRSAVDAYLNLLGTQPDANIAGMAGVSANAVRAYRVRRGIASWRESGGLPEASAPAAPVVPSPSVVPEQASSANLAWRATFADGGVKFLAATSLSRAALRAEAAGDVMVIERIGQML